MPRTPYVDPRELERLQFFTSAPVAGEVSEYDGLSVQDALIEKHLKDFRKHGFPLQTTISADEAKFMREHGQEVYSMSTEERKAAYKELVSVDFAALMVGDAKNEIKQTFEGLQLAWSYFPHRWGIECSDKISPTQAFADDETLRKVLKKVLRFAGAGISPTSLRHVIGIASGIQTVSNFRPTAAGAIYRYFLPPDRFPKGGVVWDMSMGFGGRLFGAMGCGRVAKYIGTDPSTPTFNGLRQIVEEFSYSIRNNHAGLPGLYVEDTNEYGNFHERTELHKMGSEEFVPDHESLDLCFTSPPYFDTERYTGEDTQSWTKYNSQDAWLNGFMRQTLTNCHHGLKPGAFCAVNIAPVKSYPKVCDDMIVVAEQLGFLHVDTLQLRLARLMGSKAKATSHFKHEPVFVFEKVL